MSALETVDTSERLAVLAAMWREAPVLGLDTEFVRTDTYFSRPGLIQINVHGDLVLIDLVALPDLYPLRPVLASEGVTKVMHSGAEDLALLSRLVGSTPRPLADTQIAAALCGYGPSESYRALVKRCFGVEIAKEETRSDWCTRPLSEAQLAYAAEDVRYLPALWERLSGELDALGRREWAVEEFEALGSSEPGPPYLRVRGAGRLSRHGLAILAALAQWREREARARDRPRGRVVSDSVLLALVERRPGTREQLAALEGLSPRLVRRNGAELIDIVERAAATTEDDLPLPLEVSSAHRPLLDALRAVVRQRAQVLGIAPELIASRRQLEAFVVAAVHQRLTEEHPLRSGWRAQVLGEQFEQCLREGLRGR